MVSLQLVGVPALLVDGQPVELPTRKALALAVYLAVEGPTPREALVTLLWGPDLPADRGRANLRNELYRLKKAVGFDLVLEEGGALTLAPMQVEPLVIEGADLDALRHLARAPLAAGLTLDDGEFDDWLTQQRRSRATRLAAALEREGRRLERAGQVALALEAHLARSALDSFDEAAHRDVIRAHLAGAQVARAVEHYRRLETHLATELGVSPAPETRELVQAVLEGPGRGDDRPPHFAALDAVHRSRRVVLVASSELGSAVEKVAQWAEARGLRLGTIEAQPGDAQVPWATIARLISRLLTFRPSSMLPPRFRPVLHRFGAERDDQAVDDEQLLELTVAFIHEVLPENFARVAVGLHAFDQRSLEVVLEDWRRAHARNPAAVCVGLFDARQLSPRAAAALDLLERQGLAARATF